jgi:indolepyruvate ferredoxin oxidoreductase beta subunit
MNDRTVNILFCGTGGQGVLKAAEICGVAAVFAGLHAKKSEVHGMAQRGGSVESHVRFGRQVFSPIIPKGNVDILVPFYADEEVRLKDFLKPNGKNILPLLIKFRQAGTSVRYLNTYLLGALAAYLDLPPETWDKALEQEFKTKNLEENKRIFLEGWKEVKP